METGLGFSEARKGLGRFLVPDTWWVIAYLGEVHALLKVGRCLYALDPDRFRQEMAGRRLLDAGDNDAMMTHLYQSINSIAPFDLLQAQEYDGDYLFPETLGYPMGWDEWEGVVDNIQYNQGAELYILLTALRMGDERALEAGRIHFDWDFDIPDGGLSGELDWGKMEKRLEETGLGVFNTAWDVACYATGNIYYDYNPYDEGVIPDLPPFNEDGVRYLASEWKAAQPIRERFEEANRRMRSDPEIAGQLVSIYLECITQKPGHRYLGAGMTLVEVFAGDDEAGEPIADPFYGPLTTGFEEDEGDVESDVDEEMDE